MESQVWSAFLRTIFVIFNLEPEFYTQDLVAIGTRRNP